jgi:hypothetical protein
MQRVDQQRGREFAWNHKYQYVTSAFFNQVRHREIEPPQTEVGIAFPDDKDYHFRMEPFRAFCERNRLRIFWVSENSVSEWYKKGGPSRGSANRAEARLLAVPAACAACAKINKNAQSTLPVKRGCFEK